MERDPDMGDCQFPAMVGLVNGLLIELAAAVVICIGIWLFFL